MKISRKLQYLIKKNLRKFKPCPECDFPMLRESKHDVCSGCVLKHQVVKKWNIASGKTHKENLEAGFDMQAVYRNSNLLSR